jgi:exopolyphosphatase/guanosine-5'-triphosphate,3'-diphosphate pyrophosphatase
MPTRLRRLAILLRLAVVLHRSRTSDPLPHVSLTVEDTRIRLEFPDQWLKRHPLTRLDLEQEASYLKAIDHTLTIVA